MADSRPPPLLASTDPFADRPRQTQFVEQERPYGSHSPSPRPYESTTTLAQDFGSAGVYDDDDYVEKQPLNQAPGFYPPT